MRINRHDDSQRSGRLVTQPVHPTATPVPVNSLYEKQLTAPAPADRRLRAVVGAFVVSTGVAAGVAAGYVRRRLSPRFRNLQKTGCKMLLKEPYPRAA